MSDHMESSRPVAANAHGRREGHLGIKSPQSYVRYLGSHRRAARTSSLSGKSSPRWPSPCSSLCSSSPPTRDYMSRDHLHRRSRSARSRSEYPPRSKTCGVPTRLISQLNIISPRPTIARSIRYVTSSCNILHFRASQL